MSDRESGKTLSWWAAVPAMLLFVPLLIPILTNRVFAHGDLAVFHLPLRQFYSAQLVDGQIGVWSSQLFNGYYVHGDGQVGLFHPAHLLLYRLLPLVVAFNLEIILSYILAFIGMWMFLGRLQLEYASRTVGGIAFAFSGFLLLRVGLPNAVAVSAHIPWLLLGIDQALSTSARSRALGAALIAASTGSQVLLGYPQCLWLAAVAGAIYTGFGGSEISARRWLWLPVAAGILGVLIGGVQLLPTLDLLAGSERARVDSAFRMTYSLHPLNLVQLWSPYGLPLRVQAAPEELFVHEFGVYGGSLSTLAVVWAVFRRKRLPSPRTAMFAGILIVMGIILALGRYGLVYGLIAEIPVLKGFRAPARSLLLVHLGLAMLLALTYEDLVRLAARRSSVTLPRWSLGAPLALSVVTAAIGLFWWATTGATAGLRSYPAGLITGVAFFALATTLVRDAARGVRPALLILPTFLALDLAVWGYSYALGSAPLTLDQVAYLQANPPGTPSTVSVHDATGAPTTNVLMLSGARILRPYVGLYPERALSSADERTWRLSGVEWVKSTDGWHRVDDPMPRARIVPKVRVSHDPAADLRQIDIVSTALVNEAVPTPLATTEEASAVMIAEQPGHLELAVDAKHRALLSLTESYHAGWRASRGTSGLTTLPLYGDYLGVLLEPGRYRLVLTFEPQSLQTGWYVTVAGLLGASLLTLIVARLRGGP